MAKVCEVCGGGRFFGTDQSCPQCDERRWNINLQTVRVLVKGAAKRMRVCTSCLRNAKVRRPPELQPIRLAEAHSSTTTPSSSQGQRRGFGVYN